MCKEHKPLTEFYSLGPKRGHKPQSSCKKCTLITRRKYVNKHRSEINKRELDRARQRGRRPKSVPKKDWTGETVGQIKVLGLCAGRTPGLKEFEWVCRCSCGKVFICETGRLRRGVNSCGCRSESARYSRKYTLEELAIRRSYGQAKKAAEIRNLDWNLTINQWEFLISQPCFYCGDIGSNRWKIERQDEQYDYSYNGVDRVDNDRGYHEDNCVPCCCMCNRGKLNHQVDDFLAWTRRVYLHSCRPEIHQPELAWSIQ